MLVLVPRLVHVEVEVVVEGVIAVDGVEIVGPVFRCVVVVDESILEKNIYYNCPNCREKKNKQPTQSHKTHTPGPAEILVWAG